MKFYIYSIYTMFNNDIAYTYAKFAAACQLSVPMTVDIHDTSGRFCGRKCIFLANDTDPPSF